MMKTLEVPSNIELLKPLVRSERKRWEVFGVSAEWTFELSAMEDEGENAKKYIATFFSRDGRLQKKVFIKQYLLPQFDRSIIENEFLGLQMIHETFRSTGTFGTPCPYSCLLDEKIIFMEYLPLPNLKRVLFGSLRFSRFVSSAEEKKRLFKMVSEAGRILAVLQNIPPGLHSNGGRETPEGILLRYEKLFLGNLRFCRESGLSEGLLYTFQESVLAGMHAGSERPPIVLQHTDFAPWNLLVGERALYLIDFQNLMTGFPHYDLLFFYTALELFGRYRTLDRSLLIDLQSAFLEAFLETAGAFRGAVRPSSLPRRDPLFKIFHLIQIAYFAQSMLRNRQGSLYEAFYAVPYRDFIINWFNDGLEE